MGIPDPYKGRLKENQIFLCIRSDAINGITAPGTSIDFHVNSESDDSAEVVDWKSSDDSLNPSDRTVQCSYKVITGPVLICRNPCLDPGDLRIVEAVDVPELRYWKEVVILPCADTHKYSLSAMCSGGTVIDCDLSAGLLTCILKID